MVYQGATGLYHFLINVIPFISNSVYIELYTIDTAIDNNYRQYIVSLDIISLHISMIKRISLIPVLPIRHVPLS